LKLRSFWVYDSKVKVIKNKLKGLFLLTFIILTVVMTVAALIVADVVGKPYFAEKMATDVCVPGSVRRVLVGNWRKSIVLKCTSKETEKEINVPVDNQDLGNLLTMLIPIPIPIFMAVIIALGTKLFFKENIPPKDEAQ
jgi:hypothetical protein